MASDREQGGKLVFPFDNKKPISAEELGKLFTSLARDYRQLTGRTLVVTEVQTGSLTAVLKDAVVAATPYLANAADVAKAVNAIVGLTVTLKELVNKALSPTQEQANKKTPGQASLDILVKGVETAGGEVEFECSDSRGETIKGRVTSREAIKIRERAKTERLAIKAVQGKLAPPRTDEFVDRLSAVKDENLEEAVRALAAALRSAGLESFLEMIESELDARGHYRIAAAVRAEIGRSGRSILPPITHS